MVNTSALDFKMVLKPATDANIERGSWVCWPKAFGFGIGYVNSVEVSGGGILIYAREIDAAVDYEGNFSADEGGLFDLRPGEFWSIEKEMV